MHFSYSLPRTIFKPTHLPLPSSLFWTHNLITLGPYGFDHCWHYTKQENTFYYMKSTHTNNEKDTQSRSSFIIDLSVIPTITDPIPLLCDNNDTISQTKEPRSHPKSKYIVRRFHLTREIVAKGDIVVERVPSTNNNTNPLTKLKKFLASLHNYRVDAKGWLALVQVRD